MCHLSHVTCHMSFFPPKNIGLFDGASRWRVCYQRGLPRLISGKIQKNIGLIVYLDDANKDRYIDIDISSILPNILKYRPSIWVVRYISHPYMCQHENKLRSFCDSKWCKCGSISRKYKIKNTCN